LSKFVGQRYIALETFKRNGAAVITPVWFIEQGGKLYIWTMATSGKVRRIRNNPAVRISPSRLRGRPKGNWVEANAHVIEGESAAPIIDLMRKKYGLQFWLLNHLHGRGRVVIEIEPTK